MKYVDEGGWLRLEYDLAVLGEIQQQITEARGDSAGKDGNAANARLQQRRAQRLSNDEVVAMFKERGMLRENNGG